jgi:hypothetical protein
MNLISGTHDFCERREYAFNVLPEYSIIIPNLAIYHFDENLTMSSHYCVIMIMVSLIYIYIYIFTLF